MASPPAWAAELRRLRQGAGHSQESLALEANISQSTVSQIERGAKLPTSLSLSRFTRYLSALRIHSQQFAAVTGLQVPATLTAAPMDVAGRVRLVPLFAAVGAGPGGGDGEEMGSVAIPATWLGDYAAYSVEGDSMEPIVGDGDTVVVRIQDTAQLGETVVVYCPDEGMVVKRFEITDPETMQLVLASNNRDYASVLIDEDCRILGKVVEVRRPL